MPKGFWERYNTASISPFLLKKGRMEINYINYQELKPSGLSRAAMAETFGIPEWKLKKLIAANKWGTPRPTIGNETAFDEYSEESCYWAGFLAADGCVDSENRIRLMLKYDDIVHLEKFKAFLRSTHTISSNTTTYNRCSFEFTHPHMRDMLELNFNVIPNKTDKLQFAKHLPKEWLRHYIRGYFDGDGSICESFTNRNSLRATICSGAKEFAEDLYIYLKSILPVHGQKQEFNDSIKWQITFCTNDAKTLMHYMYKDSTVYLDRKYALYQKLIFNDDRKTRDKGIVHPISNNG